MTANLKVDHLQQQIPEYRHVAACSLFSHSSVYVHRAVCFPSTVTMTSFTVAMDKVQPQFSNLYWADQQHSTSEEPCHHWQCLSACRWILLKCSFFSTFHKLNDLDCPLTIAHCSTQWTCLFDKEKSVCFFPFLLCVTFVALLFFQLRTQAAQEDEPRVKERLLMPETY